MIRTIAFTGALAVLAISNAQAQPMGSPPMDSGPMQNGAMHGGPMAGATPTPEYIHTAAQSDEFEIAEARMALHHSSNPHVIAFARKMVHDHSQSTMMIKAAIRDSGHTPPPPPPLSADQDHMLADLRSAGPNFDSTYVSQQLQSHQMALAVHKGYADGGTDPALRSAAAKIVPVVQMHLRMLNDMQSHMG